MRTAATLGTRGRDSNRVFPPAPAFPVLPSQVHPSYPYGNPLSIKHPASLPRRPYDPASRALFEDMVAKIASARYPAEQAEQAFLNLYFGAEAVRLPYAYNANLAIKGRTPALWEALQDEMRIMHFTMAKPFLQGDYAEVPLNQLERNAEKVARKKPKYKREIVEWLEAWHETRRVYRSKIDKCDALTD